MNPPLINLNEALERLLHGVCSLGTESVPLGASHGRVLGCDLVCREDRPAFDRSAMDGYAVGSVDAASFERVGELPTGGTWPVALASHQALRIFTGGALPAGTARVLPQEWVTAAENSIAWTPREGPHFIRRRGEDASCGSVLVASGVVIRAPEMALLAQEGVTEPEVVRVPTLVHLVLGSELVDAAGQPPPGGIRDSNTSLVAGLAAESGMRISNAQRLGDDRSAAGVAFRDALMSAPDLLLVSGGAGPGEHDLGEWLVRDAGMNLLFHGIDLRPGKPLLAARKGPTTALVMPGNPVSHWVTWQLVVRPLLARLTRVQPPGRILLPLASDWKGIPDARDVWWPGKLVSRSGAWAVEPAGLASSGDLCGLSGACILLHFGRERHHPAGSLVEVLIP
jgi:molybdopterin molybdotransferase